MARASISELKAHLSRYLRVVRRGGEVEILNRGVPVARLTGISPAGRGEERRARLIRAGILRPGKGNVSRILQLQPLELKSSILLVFEEERADRLSVSTNHSPAPPNVKASSSSSDGCG